MRLALLTLLLAAPATAQISWPPAQPDNPDVAFPSLRLHAPAALTTRHFDPRTRHARHTFHLLSVNRNGLAGRLFDSDGRTWSNWVNLGNPAGVPAQYVGADGGREGYDLGLVLLPEGERRRAAFFTRTAANDQVVGLPWLSLSPNLMDFDTARNPETSITTPLFETGRWFSPRSGVSDWSDGTSCRSFFGTGYPSGEPTTNLLTFTNSFLIETRQCGGAWRFASHGNPQNGGSLGVGPSAATSHYPMYRRPGARPGEFVYDDTTETLVAVSQGALRQNNRTTYSRVAVRLRDPDQLLGLGSWQDLGAPAGFRIYGTPIVMQRYTALPALGGLSEISVLAVGEAGGDFRLFERLRVGTQAWGAWQDHGRPADLAAGVPFRVTSGVLWYNGAADQRATQRMNVFGYSEPVEGGAKLLHFWSENQRWAWGASFTAPGNQGLWSQSSAAIDLATYDRISVFVRLANGRIYEHFYEIDQGWTDGWMWTNLTNNSGPIFEPVVRP